MKTSIFDMTFTLPPLIEMVEVEKDMLKSVWCWIPASDSDSLVCRRRAT